MTTSAGACIFVLDRAIALEQMTKLPRVRVSAYQHPAHTTPEILAVDGSRQGIVSSRPDPAPSQTSPPLTGIGGGFSICASIGCMPPTPEMMWRCVSSMSDCTSPTGQPAALAKSPSMDSKLGTELTQQAGAIQDEIPWFASLGLDEPMQPRLGPLTMPRCLSSPSINLTKCTMANWLTPTSHMKVISRSAPARGSCCCRCRWAFLFPRHARELPPFAPATCSQICERY
jgi:hypothetical protein